MRWKDGNDQILADLSDRLLHRRLFKTVRVKQSDDKSKFTQVCKELCSSLGFSPEYYLHDVAAGNVHSGDTKQSMLVQLDDGTVITLAEADPLFQAMVSASRFSERSWLAMPKEVKTQLGRSR